MRNRREKWARRVVGVLVAIMLSAVAAGSWIWFRPNGPIERGRSAYERGDWRDAALKARERLKAVPADRDALTLLARAAARLGRTEAAQNLYRQLDFRLLEAEDYFLVGRGLIADGQVENGRFGLERALELTPSHPEALLELLGLDRRSDRPCRRLARKGREAGKEFWLGGSRTRPARDHTETAGRPGGGRGGVRLGLGARSETRGR